MQAGPRSSLLRPLALSYDATCVNLRLHCKQPTNFKRLSDSAYHWGLAKGFPIRNAIGPTCCVVDLKWVARHFCTNVARMRSITDPVMKEVFGFEHVPTNVVHTIGSDDGTKRKHGMKAVNLWNACSDDRAPDGHGLEFFAVPIQQEVTHAKGKDDQKLKKKSRSCGEFLLDFIGGTFGKDFLLTLIADAAELDMENWVHNRCHVIAVLVDQASWEMKNWQVMTACFALIYMPGLPHRWTNWNMRKRTRMTRLSRAIRSLMRGPKGKRANMGLLHDTKTRMLKYVQDPSTPAPTWKWKDLAIQEARKQNLPCSLQEILSRRIALQSSVDKRWWRDWYTARFLRKGRFNLAMVAGQMSLTTVQDVAQNRLELLPVEEGDEDLGEVSSDDDDDAACTGDHVYMLSCLEPFLENDKLLDLVDELGGITHEVGAIFEHLQALAPGSPMSKELAEGLQKWTKKRHVPGHPCPSVFCVKLQLAQAKWFMSRKFLLNTMTTAGKHGKVGIQECLDQLQSETNFALFELMDPNLGLWETLRLTSVAKYSFVHRNPLPLVEILRSLSYEEGVFASRMASLHDAGEVNSLKAYLKDFYMSSPYTEKEQETCHKERFSNNDRRCKVAGTNFSMQRDRLSQAVQHPAYVAPREDDAKLHVVLNPNQATEAVQDHAQHGDIRYARSIVHGMSLRDISRVREVMRELKSWYLDHPNANCDLRKELVTKFPQSAPARNADALGFRAAELIVRLELEHPDQFESLQALSMSQADQMKIPQRLAAGETVILSSQTNADVDVYVTAQDRGIFIGQLLRRVANPARPDFTVQMEIQHFGSSGECLGFPETEQGVHIVCGLFIDWDHYLSRVRITTNDVRQQVVFKQGHLATTDSDHEIRKYFPAQAPEIQLSLMNERRISPGLDERETTMEEFLYMGYGDRVDIFNKLVTRELSWNKLIGCIEYRRTRELGFIAEAAFDFKPPEKKRKLNNGAEAPARDSVERKEREEAGRYAARFVAEISWNDKIVAKMASHRANKGKAAEKLKMTFHDHAPTSMGQTCTRKWLQNVDPEAETKKTFFPLLAAEFDCTGDDLALKCCSTRKHLL
eukprot:g15061.t1